MFLGDVLSEWVTLFLYLLESTTTVFLRVCSLCLRTTSRSEMRLWHHNTNELTSLASMDHYQQAQAGQLSFDYEESLHVNHNASRYNADPRSQHFPNNPKVYPSGVEGNSHFGSLSNGYIEENDLWMQQRRQFHERRRYENMAQQQEYPRYCDMTYDPESVGPYFNYHCPPLNSYTSPDPPTNESSLRDAYHYPGQATVANPTASPYHQLDSLEVASQSETTLQTRRGTIPDATDGDIYTQALARDAIAASGADNALHHPNQRTIKRRKIGSASPPANKENASYCEAKGALGTEPKSAKTEEKEECQKRTRGRWVASVDKQHGKPKKYHKDTRVLEEGGEAAPYKDLPDHEYYAPNLSMTWYKAKCTRYCGKIIPSKVAAGQQPKQHQRRRPLVGEVAMQCTICGAGYELKEGTLNAINVHFETCVERNGNPKGYHVSPSNISTAKALLSNFSGSMLPVSWLTTPS